MPRLFFALWPSEELQLAIERATREFVVRCGGRAMPRSNYHATLAFLGSIADERLDAVHAAANRVKAQSFDLRLDYVHAWRRSGIFFLGSRALPEQLSQLVAALHGELREHDFVLEERPFRLHVTLARDVRVSERGEIAPLQWPAHEFVLVESMPRRGGSHYKIIARWPLE